MLWRGDFFLWTENWLLNSEKEALFKYQRFPMLNSRRVSRFCKWESPSNKMGCDTNNIYQTSLVFILSYYVSSIIYSNFNIKSLRSYFQGLPQHTWTQTLCVFYLPSLITFNKFQTHMIGLINQKWS